MSGFESTQTVRHEADAGWRHIPDVALADQNTRVVKGLGQRLLEDEGLQAAGEKVRNLDSENVIELTLVLIEKPQASAPPQESGTLEDALGILLVKGEKLTSVLPHLGEEELHAPHLTLVLEAELADKLHLIVEALLLERTPRGLRGLRVCTGRRARCGRHVMARPQCCGASAQ